VSEKWDSWTFRTLKLLHFNQPKIMLTQNPKSPVTLSQALALADDTLTAAYHLKLDALLTGTFAENERAQSLAEFGGIAAAGSELDAIIAPLIELRRLCCRAKSTANTYKLVQDLLDTEASPLSAITTDVLAHLPYLAAGVAEDRAANRYKQDKATSKRDRQPQYRRLTVAEANEEVATARERATAAKCLLSELPATLARVRVLAETGNDLTLAGAWLK
jgi:hypothetical protein